MKRTTTTSFFLLASVAVASSAHAEERPSAGSATAPAEGESAQTALPAEAANGDESPLAASAAKGPEAPEAPAAKRAKDTDEALPDVKLHVESPSVVAIERADTGELVCTSPCDVRVPAGIAYRVGGAKPSKAFYLDASRKTDLKITVKPASKRGSVIGWSLLGGGVAALGAGVATLVAGNASRGPMPEDGLTHNGFTDSMILGTTLAISGLALSIAGGSLVLNNREARVRGNVTPAPPAKGRAPTETIKAAVSPTPALMVPILGGTF